MLFFKDMQVFKALNIVMVIAFVSLILSVTTTVLIRRAKAKEKLVSPAKAMTLRILEIIFAAALGFSVADSIIIGKYVHTAFEHGMAKVPETVESEFAGTYHETLADVIRFNAVTHKMSDVSLDDDLTGKILIFVRYDCPDCHGIFKNLPDESDSILYVCSRSDVGHGIQEKYKFDLVEVPCAVYLAPDGLVYSEILYSGRGETFQFNFTGWQVILDAQSRYAKH